MKVLDINGLKIGSGEPKICIPIVAREVDEAVNQAKNIIKYPVDLVEIRGDYFEDYLGISTVISIISKVKEIVKLPVIYTFRTKSEGGEKQISCEDYKNLLNAVINNSCAEIIDVEYFMGRDVIDELVSNAHSNEKIVIFSNHDFEKTPDKSEIVDRLKKMQESGGDIAKIAVMPNSMEDVITLLDATQYSASKLDVPVVTMSMSKLGVVSRICGEIFGSAITFGTAKMASAPGQIEANELKNILSAISKQI